MDSERGKHDPSGQRDATRYNETAHAATVSHKLLEIPSPFPLDNGQLRLLEPAGSSTSDLLNRLLEGTYGKPFILDHDALRCLHFDFDSVQSVMRRDNPDALCLDYTRKMMAFLLFNAEPRRILLLGLGGGSLAKFCYRRLPAARITAVEINPDVIALREEFSIPRDDERLSVLQGDGVEYMERRGPRKDVILVDACDRNGVAPALAGAQFYLAARRRLTLGGVFVMNICGDSYQHATHVYRIRGVFGERVIALPATKLGNRIILAFRSDARADNRAQLESQARTLKKRFGLNFTGLVHKMSSLALPV